MPAAYPAWPARPCRPCQRGCLLRPAGLRPPRLPAGGPGRSPARWHLLTDRVAPVPTGGIHHITLNVTDLARSRAFYEGILGLEVDQDLPGIKLRLRIGAARLVLCPPLPGTPPGDRFSERRIGLDLAQAVEVGGRRVDHPRDFVGEVEDVVPAAAAVTEEVAGEPGGLAGVVDVDESRRRRTPPRSGRRARPRVGRPFTFRWASS